MKHIFSRRMAASPTLNRRAAATIVFVSMVSPMMLLDGCKVGPNYKRPVIQTPGSYRGAAAPDIAPDPAAESLGEKQWAEVFRDPVLQKLVAEALLNNYDIQIAARRVLEQEAQAGITHANGLPTVAVGGNYDAIGLPGSLLKQLSNSGGSATNTNNRQNDSRSFEGGGFTSSAAWNLDFWGLYRRETEAARAQMLATEWGRQTTRATVVMNVATSYLQLRMLDSQMEITRQTIEARQQSLELTQRLERGGSTSLADVRQAEQLLHSAKAEVPALNQQIQQQENSLSILLGRRQPGPIDRGLPAIEQPHPLVVQAGLPSQLLERRPDIRAAEAELIAANAQIGAARAQFFPQFALSGQGGVFTTQLKTLVDTGNLYWLASGSVTQPIFEGVRLTNNLRLANAQQQEMLVTYQKIIAYALADVSNALVMYQKSREYREEQEQRTAAAQDAVQLARLRYNAGATAYLEVLTNDTNLYTAQLTLAQAQQQEAQSLVRLYNALGGGWR